MLTLSSEDLGRVAQAQRVLLGVLDHETPEAWMSAVAGELKGLFSAEQALVTLAPPSGYTFHTDVSESAQRDYFDHYNAVDNSGEMAASLPDPFSTDEDRSGPAHERYLTGEAYNDYFVPNGFDRNISLLAHGRVGPVPFVFRRYPDGMIGSVLLGGSEMARGKGADRARTMLALLQPAFAASARSLQALTLAVGASLDGLSVPAWFFDAAGRCAHESPQATRLVGSLAEGNALRTAAGQLAQNLVASHRAGSPAPSSWTVTVGGTALTLTGAFLDAAAVPGVVVRVEGVAQGIIDAGDLQVRFGLTPQQARVATLLAARRSTVEIAGALHVSVHTVRRHTEAVLGRLGVSSRAEVEGLVRGRLAAGPPPS